MRLIDADALLGKMIQTDRYFSVRFDIEEAPTINPEDLRPKGRWEERDWVQYYERNEFIRYPKKGLKCTNCCNVFKKELLWKRNFCPNCGAKMEERP